jgi:hypothetical protein
MSGSRQDSFRGCGKRGDAMYNATCHAPGCTKVGGRARGFCDQHYRAFRNACIENGSWGRDAELTRPKFEYEGDENALAELVKQQERAKALKSGLLKEGRKVKGGKHMSEFLKSNAKLDEVVLEATSGPNGSFENMREALKAALVGEGRISRDADSLGYGTRLLPVQHQPQSDVPLAANGFKCEREFHYHPSSGRRSLMLRANSLEELNELQAQMEKTV